MSQSAKHFAEKLNKCLDETGAPASMRERAIVLGKMINIPKQQAWSLLEGQQLPSPELLKIIAQEFEIELEWLSGSK